MHVTDMDIVRATLADAIASGLTLQDVLDAAAHADCLMCWDDAVETLEKARECLEEATFNQLYADRLLRQAQRSRTEARWLLGLSCALVLVAVWVVSWLANENGLI